MRTWTTLLLLLVATTPAFAEDLVNAAEITERNRPLDRILDLTLLPRDGPGGRTLLVVIDPTPSLATSSFAAAFRSALFRHAESLPGTAIGVLDMEGIRLAPTFDREKAADIVAETIRKPETTIQNVYAAVRRAANHLADKPGRREILLVTLENGDAEDDLERTATALVKAGVRVNVIAREAFLSDTYWLRRPGEWHPSLQMTGGESAYPELPWSFLLQRGIPNEAVASGFAIFGLTGIAAATGGRVYLHYPASIGRALCIPPGGGSLCPVCDNRHLACGEVYRLHRLRAFAPLIGSRRAVGKVAAADPYFQAAQGAWAAGAKKGVLTYRPTIAFTGAGLRARGVEEGKRFVLGDTTALAAQAVRGDKAAAACGTILTGITEAIRHADTVGGNERYRAMADYTRVMLEITRFNCLHYAAFCRQVAPAWEKEESRAPRPPEIPVLRPDYLYSRIGSLNLSLCHGVGPLMEYRFPGGERLHREMARLDRIVSEYLVRYAYSPFAQAVRRQCLATFYLIGSLQSGIPAPRWAPRGGSKGTESPSPGPQRPARGAPSGGGAGGGATSGGGD